MEEGGGGSSLGIKLIESLIKQCSLRELRVLEKFIADRSAELSEAPAPPLFGEPLFNVQKDVPYVVAYSGNDGNGGLDNNDYVLEKAPPQPLPVPAPPALSARRVVRKPAIVVARGDNHQLPPVKHVPQLPSNCLLVYGIDPSVEYTDTHHRLRHIVGEGKSSHIYARKGWDKATIEFRTNAETLRGKRLLEKHLFHVEFVEPRNRAGGAGGGAGGASTEEEED